MKDKVARLEDLAGLVTDGDHVALGGCWLSNHPMAAVRQLLRDGRRDLKILTLVGSIDVELLLAADAVRHLTFSMVSLEAFGLAPTFRRCIESEALDHTELSGVAILMGLEAQGRAVPFMAYRGPIGSDLVERAPEVYRAITCPFTGEEMLAVRAIAPDVAIVHADRADAEGNAQWDGTSGPDVEMARAAGTVVVTCEEIVPRSSVVDRAHQTLLPAIDVDAVIEAPLGAHPTSHVPRYVMDAWDLMAYAELDGDPGAIAMHVERLMGESEEAYRERVVPPARAAVLHRLAARDDLLEVLR